MYQLHNKTASEIQNDEYDDYIKWYSRQLHTLRSLLYFVLQIFHMIPEMPDICSNVVAYIDNRMAKPICNIGGWTISTISGIICLQILSPQLVFWRVALVCSQNGQ